MHTHPFENLLAPRLSLDGIWSIEIAGQSGPITVPGAWEAEGYPDVEGPARYQRSVFVPADWAGARIQIQFGAVSLLADIFVNGRHIGTHEGVWTPFAFDVTDALQIGADNDIVVEVIKAADEGDRFPYRETLAGFIPYVSTTFGGLWQSVSLVAVTSAAFIDLAVRTIWTEGSVHVTGGVIGTTTRTNIGASLYAPGDDVPCAAATWTITDSSFAGVLAPDARPRPWSPDDPARYLLVLETLNAHGQAEARAERHIGWRQLDAAGDREVFRGLRLNDAPIHLHGVLSWGWNPDARAPLFSDDEIRALFQQVRALGCNLFKLCLYIPPPRFYEIADEEGMLLWVELPLWYQRFTPHLRDQVEREYPDILAQLGHHPSVVLVSLGCELGEDMADTALIEAMDGAARRATDGALICDNSGSGEAYGGLFADLDDFTDYHFYCELHEFIPLCDHFRRDWRPARPWIFGEFCDCDDYHDPALLTDAEGNRPAWRDLLGKDGGIHRWAYSQQEPRMAALRAGGDFPFSDAELQATSRATGQIVRKTTLERTRARQDIGGYVITGLRDTPMSSSGLFDHTGRPKFEAAAFTRFNADNVLLLERGRARVWQNGGDRPALVDRFNHRAGTTVTYSALLANATPLHALTLSWRLFEGDTVLDAGQIELNQPCAAGGPHTLARFEIVLPAGDYARTALLELTLTHAAGRLVNQWPQYLYPTPDWSHVHFAPELGFAPAAGAGTDDAPVRVVAAWTPELGAWVQAGGRAIVLQADAGAIPTSALPFWREAVKLIYPHALLDAFPCAGGVDMQFYSLANDRSFERETLRALLAPYGAARLQPVLGRLDARVFSLTDYVTMAEVGAGQVIFSSLRHDGGYGDQAESFAANLAGQHLLACLAGVSVPIPSRAG